MKALCGKFCNWRTPISSIFLFASSPMGRAFWVHRTFLPAWTFYTVLLNKHLVRISNELFFFFLRRWKAIAGAWFFAFSFTFDCFFPPLFRCLKTLKTCPETGFFSGRQKLGEERRREGHKTLTSGSQRGSHCCVWTELTLTKKWNFYFFFCLKCRQLKTGFSYAGRNLKREKKLKNC